MKFALDLSRSEIPLDPFETYDRFFVNLSEGKFTETNNIFQLADEIAKSMIIVKLNEIPWRVSCEYLRTDDKINWINTWVKIGWWTKDKCETSPQLLNREWVVSENGKLLQAYDNTKVKSTVVEGNHSEFIFQLMKGNYVDNKINVEFAEMKGNKCLIPINVAFSTPQSIEGNHNVFDLARIEVGSLIPFPDHELDAFRDKRDTSMELVAHSILQKTILESSNTTVKFYQGSTC